MPGSAWPPSFDCHAPAVPPQVTCDALRDSFKEGGRVLPGMLRSRGIDITQVSDVFVGSFSAGHGVMKGAGGILANDADRALVRVVTLADSTYTSWLDQAKRIPNPPDAYAKYAMDCLTSDRLFIATCSNHQAGIFPSGQETVRALVKEIEKRSGRKFTVTGAGAPISGFGDTALRLPPVFAGVTPAPKTLYSLGNVLFADYDMTVPHGEHASKLMPQVWRNIVIPWWTAAPAPPGPSPVGPPVDEQPEDSGPGTVAKVFAFLGGAAAGYAGVRAWRRRS